MDKIVINREKCVGCSECVKDCVASALYIKDGKATLRDGCIECGHCFAVCPADAVDMPGYDKSGCVEITPMTEIDSKTLLQAMKSRRTIRQYKDIPVEQEKIEKIIEAGKYAPTGSNSQNVAFTILGSKQAELEKDCVKLFRTGVGIGSKFSKSLGNVDINDRFFFKGAPLVIVVSAHNTVNGTLASAYMEIMANSLGLGVLYSGFFCACTKINPLIKAKLNLPKGHKAVTCMIIGYPDVKYKRIAPRKDHKTQTL
ncbi:MAG: nitroreductase family protein [Eubacterium sp.]|nr:nitroreductase family protein [Eubacterium sp.]MBR7060873.1 nitroreductase family protein [Eubacterium sp.]